MPGGALLLMDAGCELHGYASDVSRTWPVGGAFSPAQRDVYSAVLASHAACLAAARPGATLRRLHAMSVRAASEALLALGVLPGGPGAVEAVVASGSYRPFYLHSLGHWLGLDTHDTASVSHDTPLAPGVVITIEPGL